MEDGRVGAVDFLLDVEDLQMLGDAIKQLGGNVLEERRLADAVAANEAVAATVRDRETAALKGGSFLVRPALKGKKKEGEKYIEHDDAAELHGDIRQDDVGRSASAADIVAELAVCMENNRGTRELLHKLVALCTQRALAVDATLLQLLLLLLLLGACLHRGLVQNLDAVVARRDELVGVDVLLEVELHLEHHAHGFLVLFDTLEQDHGGRLKAFWRWW